MKKIGVIVPSFTIDYAQEFLKGIYNYFAGKDVKVVIAQTQIPNTDVGLFDYQYWNSVDLISSQCIDAYIVPMGLYTVKRNPELLREVFKPFTPRPVICSAIDINLENSYSVIIDCNKSINDMVNHLIEKHNCKKIAFMSANNTNSKEALERFEAYKLALKNNGLKFSKSLVFEGGYTDFGAYEALENKFSNKEQIDFDAVVCANDLMAVGTINFLKEKGLSVPNDVKVTGFDDSQVATFSTPRLSTINQQIQTQAMVCGRLAEQVLGGEKIPKQNYTNLDVILRQSCGCVDVKNPEYIHKDINGKLLSEAAAKHNLLMIHDEDNMEKTNITTLIDMVKISNTLRQLYYNLKYVASQAELYSLHVSFYDNPLYITREELVTLPNQAELYMYADTESGSDVFNPGIKFNPKKNLFPLEVGNEKPGIYILQPIFSGEGMFGFITGKLKNTKFPSYLVYLKLIISGLSQAYDYTKSLIQTEKLESENNQLEKKSKTDELTGILNRRGFMEAGQRTLDILQEMSSAGVIFFADMDNLKTINDTYGHKMGDKAIKLQAKVLKSVFRNSDIVGRLSGDEFGIIAKGMLIDYVTEIHKKIDNLNRELSIKQKLPFYLSTSLGAVDLENGSSLLKLLNEADKALYNEKKRKHLKQNKQLELTPFGEKTASDKKD